MIGLLEAERNLSDLVNRASKGESTGITRRGKLVAILVPPTPKVDLAQIFANIEDIRRRAKPLKGFTIEDLIEEGRR